MIRSRQAGIALVAAALGGLAVLGIRSPVAAPIEVPFHLIGSTMLLPVRIAHSDTLWFILDTGAEHGAVNQPRAEQLGLRVTGDSQARGTGGTVAAHQLAPFDVELGPIRLRAEHYAAYALVGLPQRMGHVVDGIVGSELFRRYVVEIDYARSAIRLYEPKSYEYRGPGQKLPLTYANHHPYIHARIVLADGRKAEGRFVVDTGSSQGLILLPAFAEREKVAATVAKTIPVSGVGVGGESSSRMGRIAAVELGSLRLRAPTASLPPPGGGQYAVGGSAGNLGGAILKKFRCIFDYSRDQMILEPVSDLDVPIPYDASGLLLVTAGAAFDTVVVARVVPGSPAAEAGLQPGDRIRALDDAPAATMGVLGIRERLRRVGAAVRLEVARGDRTWTVPLTLRDLL